MKTKDAHPFCDSARSCIAFGDHFGSCDQNLNKEHKFFYKLRSIQSKSPPFPIRIVSIERHHDGGDVQRCLGMQLSGSKANTSNRALTILTSQIIPCLPPSTVDPRLYQFELLEFYPGCSLSGVQAGGPAYLEKDERVACDPCEDTFLSATSLNYHMSKQHKEMSVGSVFGHILSGKLATARPIPSEEQSKQCTPYPFTLTNLIIFVAGIVAG